MGENQITQSPNRCMGSTPHPIPTRPTTKSHWATTASRRRPSTRPRQPAATPTGWLEKQHLPETVAPTLPAANTSSPPQRLPKPLFYHLPHPRSSNRKSQLPDRTLACLPACDTLKKIVKNCSHGKGTSWIDPLSSSPPIHSASPALITSMDAKNSGAHPDRLTPSMFLH
jgi:hypothetical protein